MSFFHTIGFVTPRNKNILTSKTIFSDKVKVALGDCKNTAFNTMTPMKSGNVFIEKTKSDAVCQPATPKISNISNVSFLTPTAPTARNCSSQKSDLEIWNEQLMLSEDQFNLLFMESNEDIAPPMPSPEPVREFSNSYVEFSPTSWINFDYESTFEPGCNEEDELPSLNLSFDLNDSFRD